MAKCAELRTNNFFYHNPADINYCQPNFHIVFYRSELENLPLFSSYSGTILCASDGGASVSQYQPSESYPCVSGKIGLKPVEYFLHFDIKPAYVEHSEFAEFEEYFVMSQEQIDVFVLNFDTIAFFFVAFTMMAAFVKGFNTGMNS